VNCGNNHSGTSSDVKLSIRARRLFPAAARALGVVHMLPIYDVYICIQSINN